MDTTIILPQRNRSDLTLATLNALRRHDPQRWPVIIVDDGSEPIHRDAVAANLDRHTLLLCQETLGVTAAWNAAARRATTPYLLLLNNDVQIVGPFVGELIAHLRNGAVLAGPELRHEGALPADTLNRLPTAEFLAGWCFALRRNDFLAVGGFDESMTLYWSDTDLQARLLARPAHSDDPRRAMAPVPLLSLWHLGHQTARLHPRRRERWRADRDAFIRKWSPR